MTTPYITIGCPTTGGGQVISGNSMFLVDGIAISCVGDKATCPTHKVTATIVSGDPHMNILGKLAARAGDSLSCGCKLLPKQSLVVQDNGGGNSTASKSNAENFLPIENFGHRFLLKDQLTDAPLTGVCYEIVKNGETIHGKTDKQGFTELITNTNSEEITINIIYEEHTHG
ncbi:PAAR domain-containing protein [Acinetobacter sp. 161(2023)]|uniref:PAAR domain-containing protein n=1 Tax=Acinetobacter sp. 161(2023) TaxID=3098768 RepID=UPI00300B07DC